MRKVPLMDIEVSLGRYQKFLEAIVELAKEKRPHYVCVANVHMVVEAYKSSAFAEVVRNASIITPDGKPVTWAIKLLHQKKQDRVAGMDLLPDLLKEAANKDLKVFFYGGSDELLKKTGEYIALKYPGLNLAGTYSPPFRKLSEEEEKADIESINSSGANLVFVVLGCPKQEKWMRSVSSRINAVLVGVGGALPVLIGVQKRAPRWMQVNGLEWLFRLFQEPKRLFKRYAVTNTTFLYLLLREMFKTRTKTYKIKTLDSY